MFFLKRRTMYNFGSGDQTPPNGCGENRSTDQNGIEHVTRWTPDFRRSVNILPNGQIEDDHIGPNAGIGYDRQPFSSPYDQWNPRNPGE